MSELVKNILMWLFIAATLFTVFNNFSSEPKSEVISYSEFLSQVESDQVLSVQFENDNYTIKGKTVNDRNFETVKPPFLQDNLSEILRDHRVSVIGEKPEEQSIFKQLLVASFPILIILAVFIFFMRPISTQNVYKCNINLNNGFKIIIEAISLRIDRIKFLEIG